MKHKHKLIGLLIVFSAATVIICLALKAYSTSSSQAAINNLKIIDGLMESNGNVKVGNNWELLDNRTNFAITNKMNSTNKP